MDFVAGVVSSVATVVSSVVAFVHHTFCNHTPATGYDPAENIQAADGVILGNLNTVDVDGDPLSFTVTDGPDAGSVVVGPDDRFTYTADAGLAETGGTDEFTAKVSDAGWHLHGLAGLLNVISFGLTGDPGHTDMAISPDGAHTYVTNQDDGTLSVIQL